MRPERRRRAEAGRGGSWLPKHVRCPFRCSSSLSPLPCCIGSIHRPYFEGNLSSPVPVPVRSGFCVAGGMHKGGLSGAVSIPSCGGSWPLLPAWGEPSPPRRPPGGGNEKGGEIKSMLPLGSSFLSERVTGGG